MVLAVLSYHFKSSLSLWIMSNQPNQFNCCIITVCVHKPLISKLLEISQPGCKVHSYNSIPLEPSYIGLLTAAFLDNRHNTALDKSQKSFQSYSAPFLGTTLCYHCHPDYKPRWRATLKLWVQTQNYGKTWENARHGVENCKMIEISCLACMSARPEVKRRTKLLINYKVHWQVPLSIIQKYSVYLFMRSVFERLRGEDYFWKIQSVYWICAVTVFMYCR